MLECNFPSTTIPAQQQMLKFKFLLACSFYSLFFLILLSKPLLHERMRLKNTANAGEHNVGTFTVKAKPVLTSLNSCFGSCYSLSGKEPCKLKCKVTEHKNKNCSILPLHLPSLIRLLDVSLAYFFSEFLFWCLKAEKLNNYL